MAAARRQCARAARPSGMACASGAARLRADRATGGSCAHTNGHCGAGGACTRVCTRVRGGPERDERATRREGCFSGPPRHTPPLLALSGVSGGAGSPQWVGGSLSVPPGLGAGWWPPAQSKGNALGVVGPWHPHPGFLIPGRCQLLSPPQLPALYWEPGWGHPETRGPGQAGLSGQGDFCLKINGEAKLLIIRLGGR